MTSTPSNNLKEQVATEIQLGAIVDKYKHRLLNANQLADNTVDLILDTILAEIGEAPEDTDKYGNELLGKWLERGRIRTMLEGLRT